MCCEPLGAAKSMPIQAERYIPIILVTSAVVLHQSLLDVVTVPPRAERQRQWQHVAA